MKVKTLTFQSTQSVELEDENGGKAKVVFRRAKRKDDDFEKLAIAKELEGRSFIEKRARYHKFITDKLISVSGLYEDDAPLTVEDIKDGKALEETLELIYTAYNAIGQKEESEEKKDLKAESLPSSNGE